MKSRRELWTAPISWRGLYALWRWIGERALDMTRKGFSTMTELADELVRSQGLSFAARQEAGRQAGASGP